MKTNLKRIPPAIVPALMAVSVVFAAFLGCRKEDPLDVDISKSPVDAPAKTDLDNWIKTTLTDPYNIELVYRFDRNLTYPDRNISPVELERVVPTAEALLHTYLKVYEKVAGTKFIKTYTPKQFVLYGSPAYNSNGSITLGTAEGGRRVVLYEINEINFAVPAQVRRKMRTIHHEFTHIVNQNIAIPPAFEQVSKADYYSDWTNNTANSAEIARSLGFVSRYARSEFKEDFAEMVAHLIVEGQHWFDAYATAAGANGQDKLKGKEALVVEYYKQYYGIDFRKLQREFAIAVRDRYQDPRFSPATWVQDGRVSIKVDPQAPYNQKYAISAAFGTLYQTLVANLSALSVLGSDGRKLVDMDFRFLPNGELDLVIRYENAAGTNWFLANFSYTYTINADGEMTFARVAQRGTTTPHNNAVALENPNAVNPLPLLPLQDFLTGNVFVLEEWTADHNVEDIDFMKMGKFYVKDDPANFVYGTFALIN